MGSLRRALLWFLSAPHRARLFAKHGPRTLNVGGATLVFRWADVCAVLENDSSFLIGPINAARIEAVSDPFLLGMDRSPQLWTQHMAAYRAWASVDLNHIEDYLRSAPPAVLAKHSGILDVVNQLARPMAMEVACRVFGVRGPDEGAFKDAVRSVFHETFLNLQNDPQVARVGREAGGRLTSWIVAEIVRRRTGGISAPADMLGALLDAQSVNGMNDSEIAAILAGFLVGSIDTTTTAVANIMLEALSDPTLLHAMRADVDDAGTLRGWCWEALRRRPHNHLLLRVAAPGAAIAGKAIPAGTTVFCMLLTAMQDAAAWPDPKRLDPTRPRDRYLHFGRALHHCGGRDLNAIQIPALVGALLRYRPQIASAMTFEGPFPSRLLVRLGGQDASA